MVFDEDMTTTPPADEDATQAPDEGAADAPATPVETPVETEETPAE